MQAFAQPPQLATSLLKLVSQPFFGKLSQSLKPAEHWIAQVPELHVAIPLVESHEFVQAPQLAGSVATLVSQPFPAIPSQSSHPGSQTVTPHFPLTHAGTACGSSHTFPHEIGRAS